MGKYSTVNPWCQHWEKLSKTDVEMYNLSKFSVNLKLFSPHSPTQDCFSKNWNTPAKTTPRGWNKISALQVLRSVIWTSVLRQRFPNTSVTVESKGIHYLTHSLEISWNGPLPCWNKCLKRAWWVCSHSVVPQFIISDTSFSTTRPRASHSLADLLAPELELWIRV